MKHKILLVLAVVFGLLAFILTYQQLEAEKAKIAGDAENVVLIRLANAKEEGDVITEKDVVRFKTRRKKEPNTPSREIPWSEVHASVIGRKLATPMAKNQILQYTDLQLPTQCNGFNALVRKKMRAVSVAVDPVSSVNYLIQPNDQVDVIGTFRFPNVRGDAELDTVTVTILQSVRVLAVGNRWGSNAIDPMGSRNYGTITLLLYPDEVEMITFAAQKGQLTFSLRNYEDSAIDKDIQARKVNFGMLEKEIPKYNQKRQERRGL